VLQKKHYEAFEDDDERLQRKRRTKQKGEENCEKQNVYKLALKSFVIISWLHQNLVMTSRINNHKHSWTVGGSKLPPSFFHTAC